MEEELEKRQAEILAALELSAAQHNALMGRLQEVKDLIAKLASNEKPTE